MLIWIVSIHGFPFSWLIWQFKTDKDHLKLSNEFQKLHSILFSLFLSFSLSLFLSFSLSLYQNNRSMMALALFIVYCLWDNNSFVFGGMKKNSNKYTLLNKKEEPRGEIEEIEMIEMDQLSSPKQPQKDSENSYVTLKEEPVPQKAAGQPQKQGTPNGQQRVQNYGSSQGQGHNQHQQRPYQNPGRMGPQYQVYSNMPIQYSDQNRPTVIRMNGSSFRREDSQKPKNSGLPEMEVACESCTMKQRVPGNTQIYACGCCNEMNECYPLYGLFVCGKCQKKVCYPYGTSENIRCTICSTINRVPTQPKRRYKSTKDTAPGVTGRKNQAQEVADRKDLEREEVMGNQPGVIREQEILFDDVSSLREIEEEDKKLQYPQI